MVTMNVRLWSVTVALVVTGIFLADAALAQPDPLRWGRLTDADLALTEFADDPDAPAVILGEYGTVQFRQNMSMTYEVHRRVKVLAESGYDLATVQFSYLHRDRRQTLRRLDAHTFVPDGRGGTRRVALSNSDVFREVDGSWTRVRFTMPALEPGAIFEYRYSIQTDGPYLFPTWFFQDVVPTLHSEFRAQIPRRIVFNVYPNGNPRYAVEDIREREFDIREFQREAGLREGTRRETFVNEYRWVMQDVEALQDEDFVASKWDHAYGLRFQLAGYYDHNTNFRGLAETWDDVAVQLRDSEFFGRRYRASQAIRRQAEDLVDGAAGSDEVVQRIYDFVRQSVVWDKRYAFTAERSLNRVLDSRSGTSGEVNLLLLSLLTAAGIDANPVLVSTRGSGRVQTFFPSASQFNHVVVQVNVGGSAVLLDATDPHRPAGMLPVAALSHDGLLLTPARYQWISLLPAPGTMAAIGFTGEIDPSGAISGNMTGRLAGYSALRARQRLAESAATGGHEGTVAPAARRLELSEVIVNGVEGDGPILFAAEFSAPGHVQAVGHLLTFNPVLQGRLEQNPFRQGARSHPVDFTHPVADVYEARLTLPEGYIVDGLPAPVERVLDRQGGVFRRAVSLQGRTLLVQRQFVLTRHVYEPEEYPALRRFYEDVAAADAEMVVLVRDAAPAAGAPPDGGAEP